MYPLTVPSLGRRVIPAYIVGLATLTVGLALPALAAGGYYSQAGTQAQRVRSVIAPIVNEYPHVVAGQSLTLKASLRYNNQPLKGRTLRFQVRYSNVARTPWQSVGSAQTDDKGVASVTVTVPADAVPDKHSNGSGAMQVSFGGDVTAENGLLYKPTSHYTAFTIVRPAPATSKEKEGSDPPAVPATPPDTPPPTPPAGGPAENASGATTDTKGASKANGSAQTPSAPDGEGSAPNAPPLGPVSLTLMRELRNCLGAVACNDAVRDSNLSDRVAADAVALVASPAEAKPRRFWMEMRVDEMEVTSKQEFGFRTKLKSHCVLTATLLDTVLGTRTTETFRADKDETLYRNSINDALKDYGDKIKTDAKVKEEVTQKLLSSAPGAGKAIKEATQTAARWSLGLVKSTEWAGRIVTVDEGEYYLAGASAIVGDRLQVTRLVNIGDNKTRRKNKGILEVKEITGEGVIVAKLVEGVASKNDIVFKIATAAPSAVTVSATKP